MSLTRKLLDTTLARLPPLQGPKTTPKPVHGKEQRSFEIKLAPPGGGKPWLNLKMGFIARQGPHGIRTRMLAHMETCLPVLQTLPNADSKAARRFRNNSLMRKMPKQVRTLSGRVLGHIATRKVGTLIDVNSATLPFHRGASPLASEVVERLGLTPAAGNPHRYDRGETVLEHWQHHFVRPDGDVCYLTALHASNLPLNPSRTTGRQNITATVITTVESGEKTS